MGLKQVYERWTSINLVIRILAGLLIGAVLALAVPGLDPVGMLGTLFVNALKAIAPILVMILVMSALANSKPGLGSKFTLVLALYIGSTVVAATVAVLMSYMFPLTVTLIEPGETQEVVTAFNELQGEGVRAVTCASDIQQWTNQVAGAIDAVRFALGGVTVAVAALSVALVASVTVIAAMERRDELAILRALGASRRDAVVLLVGGNAIVGLFAGLVGGVLALVVAGALDPIVTQAIGASGLFAVPAWVVFPAAALGAALAALSALVPAVLSQK